MTKINLLPHRRARHLRHEQWMTMQILGLAGVLGLLIIFGGFIWASEHWRRAQLDHDFQVRQAEYSVLTGIDAETENLVQQKSRLIQQHDRLREILLQRSYPSLLLDFVTDGLEPLNLWLEQLQVTEGHVTLQGMSLSQRAIFQLVEALHRTDLFQKPQVQEIRSTVYQNVSLYQFTLTSVMKTNFQHDSKNL